MTDNTTSPGRLASTPVTHDATAGSGERRLSRRSMLRGGLLVGAGAVGGGVVGGFTGHAIASPASGATATGTVLGCSSRRDRD